MPITATYTDRLRASPAQHLHGDRYVFFCPRDNADAWLRIDGSRWWQASFGKDYYETFAREAARMLCVQRANAWCRFGYTFPCIDKDEEGC